MAIKKGDNVIVIAGKERGKQGKVARLLPDENRIIVEGMNMIKKHRRPRKAGEKGQLIEIASPLNISNVQLYCESCKKGVRLGSKDDKGKKVRICVSCKKAI
jgi:large subunit ribosomal protein L24